VLKPKNKGKLSLVIKIRKQAKEFQESLPILFNNHKKVKDQEILKYIEKHFDDKNKAIDENKAKDADKLYVVKCDEYE